MCVIDYITWTTVQRDFTFKLLVDQTTSQLKRTENLAKIERDDSLVSMAIQRLNEVELIAEESIKTLKDIDLDCKYIKEGLYYQILNSPKGAEAAMVTKKPSPRLREHRMHILKKVQGVEARVKLTQLLAINESLDIQEDRLSRIKNELSGGTYATVPDDERK